MKILVIGGTRFFGIHMVNKLLECGHDVTIATRGKATDEFGDRVKRITLERTNETSVKEALSGTNYDVVIDKIAYCSNDIRYVMDVVDCDKYIHMSSTAVYKPKHLDILESDFDGTSTDFVWCNRTDFSYDQIKRHAEYALWQKYSDKNWIAVRYPFVIGKGFAFENEKTETKVEKLFEFLYDRQKVLNLIKQEFYLTTKVFVEVCSMLSTSLKWLKSKEIAL